MTNRGGKSFEDLPVLVIECILSHLTYHHVLKLRLLSCYWDSFIKEYLAKADKRFLLDLAKYRVQWVAVKEQVEDSHHSSETGPFAAPGGSGFHKMKKLRTTPKMSPRIYHLSCYVDDYMYVFGGCVSYQTAYNDLWRFDVKRKKWLRIVAEGTLPLPRVFSSFTLYNCRDEQTGQTKQYIVLFGGYLIIERQSPVHMDENVLKTIHLFDIANNRWTLIDVKGDLELKSCCHSAVIIDHELIVANGFTLVSDGRYTGAKTEVFVFDLRRHCWRRQRTEGSIGMNNIMLLASFPTLPKLSPNAFVMDDRHILFVGYSTGRLNQSLVAILELDDDDNDDDGDSPREKDQSIWKWSVVKLIGFELDSKIGSICKVGDLLAYLTVKNEYFDNVSANRGIEIHFKNHNTNPLNRRHSLHERRIELLDYYERFFFNRVNHEHRKESMLAPRGKGGMMTSTPLTMMVPQQKITLQLNLLDLSKVTQEHILTKLEQHYPIDYTVAPDAFPYYSLVATPTSMILSK